MTDNPASKNPNALRVDHAKKLIHVPGRDKPDELIAPIHRRYDENGQPVQAIMTPEEINELRSQHMRRVAIVFECMNANWRCTQCGRVWPGTKLRVKWDKIDGATSEYLFCPDSLCDAPCAPVDPTPVTEAIHRGELG